MATNPNDIQLRIQAAVDGLQDVGKLLSEIDELGGDTSAASQDVEQLNEQMQQLSQQRSLIQALERTRGRVDEAAQAMEAAEGQADELRTAYEQSAQGVEAQRRAAEQAARSAEQASEAYQQQRRELQALQTQYKGVQQSTTGARQAWRDAAQRVKDLEQAIEASGEATDDQARQLEQARGAAEQARRSYEQQAESLSGIRDELQEQRQSVDRAKQSWEDYRDESRDLNRELKDSERAFARQGKELDRAEQSAAKARTSFERQGQSLEELSEDARAAGIDVDNLADEQQRLDRESQQLEGSVDSLKDELRNYRQEVDRTEGGIRKLGRSLAQGVKRFGAWTAAAAAGAAALSVGVLTRYTAAQAEAARQIDNTSEAIDVNAQRLQELQYAFDRVGIDADKTGDLLKDVADKIGDAYENGGGEAKDAIDALGLSLDELIGLRPDEQLLRIAGALDSLPPASQVNVMESLANDASLLLPLLRDNAAGLRELTDEANQLGAIMDPEQIENLKATNAAIERIQGRLQGLKNRLIGEVSPAVNDLAESFDDLLEDNPGLVDDLSQVFRGLIQTTQRWMEYVITNREKVGGALQSLIDTAQFLGHTFEAVFRGVQMVIAGILSGVAQAYSHVRSLMEGVTRALNAVGLASDETLAKMRAHSEAARAAVRDLEQQTLDYGRQAIQAGADAVNAYDNTADAAGRAGQAAEDAAGKHDQLSNAAINSAILLADAADTNAQQQARLTRQLDAARAEHERLREELRKNPSSELAQKVGEAANEVGRLERELRAAERAGRDNAKAMAAAADAIGLTLDELRTGVSDSAAEAIEGFETLARSGTLSAEQLEDAFQATWQNLDSPEAREAFLESIRQMVADGVEGAGQWLSAWKEAFKGLEEGADGAADSVKGIGDAAREAQADTDDAARTLGMSYQNILDNLNASIEAANNAWGIGRRQLYEGMIKKAREWRTSQKDAADASRDHASAVDEQTRAMEQAEQASQRLNDSLESSIAQMREQLAQLEGDQARVQELQYERQRVELQEQLNAAREAGDRDAQQRAREALRLAEEIHQRRLTNIRQEQRERDRQIADEARAEYQRATTGQVAQAAGPSRAAQAAQPTRAVRITLDTPSGTAQLTADSERDEQLLIDALGRDARRTTH